MKLNRRELRVLIESLLSEVGLGVGMDPTGATMPQGMKRSEYNQLEAADPNVVEEVIKILDPTGVTSVPDIPPAHMEFKRDPSLFNAVMLVLAVAAAIPVAGKLAKLGSKGLNAVKKTLSAAKKILPKNFASKADEGIKAIDKAAAGGKIGKAGANIRKMSVADARKQYPDSFIKSNSDSGIVKDKRRKAPSETEDIGSNNITSHEDMVGEFNEMKKMYAALGDYSVKPLMIGKEGNKTFIVMEKIKGEYLPNVIRNLRKKYQKPLSKEKLGDMDAIMDHGEEIVKVTDSKDIELIKSIKAQFAEIQKKLKSSGYYHGDLTQGRNVMITSDKKLKVIDPSAQGFKSGKQSEELDTFLKQLDLFDVS